MKKTDERKIRQQHKTIKKKTDTRKEYMNE